MDKNARQGEVDREFSYNKVQRTESAGQMAAPD